MSPPQTRKAPTAAANPPLGAPVDTSSAAPGVDQAIATGIRVAAAHEDRHDPGADAERE